MSGGNLAAGNSIGTLTVNGNLTFNAGGTYTVEFSPSAADRSNVTGAATLTGATVQAIALPGSFRQPDLHHPECRRRFGGTQFAGLNVTGSSLSPGARNPHLTYDANNVFLVLDPGTIQLPSGASGNQAGVAGGINRAVLGGATPPAGFDVLLNLEGTRLTNALTQVSGETAVRCPADRPSTRQACSWRMMTDPFNAGRSDAAAAGGTSSFAAEADAYAASRSGRASEAYGAIVKAMPPTRFEQRWSVWAAGLWRRADHRRQCRVGTGHHHQPDLWRHRAAPTIASRRIWSWASRWPAAAPILASPMAAAAVPTCSRPARSRVTIPAPSISPARWPMAGRTSPPTAPSPSQASTGCKPASMPIPTRAASKAATVSSTPWMDAHALRRRTGHVVRAAGLCRTACCPGPTHLR